MNFSGKLYKSCKECVKSAGILDGQTPTDAQKAQIKQCVDTANPPTTYVCSEDLPVDEGLEVGKFKQAMTQKQCEDHCAENLKCNAFSYHPKYGCFLKSF